MLKSLHIEGYRCFKSFSLDDLTRVNLIVGKNNSGKTCLLEALEILFHNDKLEVIIKNNQRRKEYIQEQSEEKRSLKTDISQLFYGRGLKANQIINIEGYSNKKVFVRYEVIRPVKQLTLFDRNKISAGSTASPQDDYFASNSIAFVLKITSNLIRQALEFPISGSGYLIPPYLQPDLDTTFNFSLPDVYYILSGEPNLIKAGLLWDEIVLTPNEQKVIDAMKIIEPTIEKIAILSRFKREPNIYAKLQDYEQRVSLGSLGDGFKHLFSLAVNLVHASDGILLIDEIDTGFHYSVLLKMWKLIFEISRQYNIQVFATTHSYDCVGALARLYKESPEYQDEIALYRIEKESPKGIRYSAKEISIAAEQLMEIR